MNLEQLIGRYLRLKQELAAEYGKGTLHARHIERLGREIATTEHAIRALRSTIQRSLDAERLVA